MSFHGSLEHFTFSQGSSRPENLSHADRRIGTRSRCQSSSSTSSPEAKSNGSPQKKLRKAPRKYAPPSMYQHLGTVPDYLGPDLQCVFIGLNPGIATAQRGHFFAGPTNLFWRLMYESKFVSHPVSYEDDVRMSTWGLGLTNIISRPTAEASELSREELVAAVPSLHEKISRHKPQAICVVGKGIYDAMWRARHDNQSLPKSFDWGLQPESFAGCRTFVVPSTSGRVAAYSREFKLNLWTKVASQVR